jgi:CheY-like chemotaxis protein
MTEQTPCSRRVFVVEDDRDIREAVVEILEDHAYKPVPAENGAVALQRLRAGGPDPCLILLDVMMPAMDGFQFRAEQEKDPSLAAIPVVLFTAHAAVSPTSIGAVGVLKKPIDFEALLSIIEEHCGPAQ